MIKIKKKPHKIKELIKSSGQFIWSYYKNIQEIIEKNINIAKLFRESNI